MSFRANIDTNGQRSYFSQDILHKVKGRNCLVSSSDFQVNIFLCSQLKKIREVMFDIKVNTGIRSVPDSIDDDFNIEFNIQGFHPVTKI